MSSTFLIAALALSLTIIWSPAPASATEYDGYYDLSAKDTGYLCSKMDEYLKTGVQPDIITHPHNDFPKDKYLRHDHQCWKNRWNPCSDEDLKKSKPCGWYQMEEAPASECEHSGGDAAAAHHGGGDAAAEEAPAEEAPAEEGAHHGGDAPAEETPTEETPAEEAPAEETPAEEGHHGGDAAAEEAPAEEAAEEAPAE